MDIEDFKKANCFWCEPLSAWITKKGCFLYRCRITEAETQERCTPKCPEYKTNCTPYPGRWASHILLCFLN